MDVHGEAAALARSIFALRRQRARHLPTDLLSDVAWNMLLALFVARADGERLTPRDVIRSAEVAVAVGLRWFAVLEKEGFVSGSGELDEPVALTPRGGDAMEACMIDARRYLRTRTP